MSNQNKDLEHQLSTAFGDAGKGKKYKTEPKEMKEKSSAMAASGPYVVRLHNESSNTFPSIKTRYISAGQQKELEQKNVAPNRTADFNLSDCNSMQGYIMGFFDENGQLVYRIPEQGFMTAQRATQEYPSDTNPCADEWSIQSAA
jgi:hypothetical protein